MEGSKCDGEGGWTRAAFVNMSEPGSSYLPGLVQYDNIFNTSLCWINNGTYFHGCNSTLFSTYNLNYTKVCDRVRDTNMDICWIFIVTFTTILVLILKKHME